MSRLSNSAQRVQDALEEQGLTLAVMELPESTRTALEAAEAVGCQVGQIVKSLIFETQDTGRPVLIVTSGANRVNEERVGEILGEAIRTGSANFVREETGFAIGGVAPVGLKKETLTYIDEDLLAHEEIWAAAGTPYAVFKLTPEELKQITGGRVISVL
ncbi:MAG: Cys-tRNA(Pro)/Cys-tRNA(Cys) deacylase YbaK [Chloroflexi bacterium]|nr:Cys-tRNA(Pro)/Cys-tRNA(Cys) deacylase YbaK [Chloroflexota bacterium]